MLNNDKKPLVLIGGGGHASVLLDILLKQKRKVIAVVSPNNVLQRNIFSGLRHLKRDSDINAFGIDEILLVNGIGLTPGSDLRRKITESYKKLGFKFDTVIADSAEISKYAEIGEGAQILHNSTIQAGVEVGMQCIINSCALVEHDCRIEDFCHVAPNSTLCGQVSIAKDCFIGAGAVVVPSINIGRYAVIGAGVVVNRDVEGATIIYPPSPTSKKIEIKGIK